ncbi:hypothetical protein TNCV_1902211 [Trichonephila clavipes]|nr:hypothetical protein TNCV_1902211 [Trichonephila clavipes]
MLWREMVRYRVSSARRVSHQSESDALVRKDTVWPCISLEMSVATPGPSEKWENRKREQLWTSSLIFGGCSRRQGWDAANLPKLGAILLGKLQAWENLRAGQNAVHKSCLASLAQWEDTASTIFYNIPMASLKLLLICVILTTMNSPDDLVFNMSPSTHDGNLVSLEPVKKSQRDPRSRRSR